MSDPAGEVCQVPNIGPEGVRARRRLGVLGLIGAAALLAVLVVADAPRAARLLVAFPLWTGLLGVLQARERT